MNRILSSPAVITVLLFSGLVHGLWTDRWSTSAELQQAAARVDLVPLQIGDWQGEAQAADPEAFQQTGAHAYWLRRYTHATTKLAPITVVLMCGRAGRMAVHTPEICYGGAGFDIVHGRRSVVVSPEQGNAGTFWSARFSKDADLGRELLLFWSWNDGLGWQAPSSPRWHFRGSPYLYKLYVVRDVSGSSRADDEIVDFLRQFLPAVEHVFNVTSQS